MVVRLAVTMWWTPRGSPARLNCVAGALAAVAMPGIAAQPTPFDGGSPCWLQPSGIETVLRNTELSEIGLLPQQPQPGATTLNNTFTPPPPFPSAVGLGLPGSTDSKLAATGIVHPVTTELVYGVVPTETEDFSVVQGPAAKITGAAPVSIPVVCRSQLPQQLQAGGTFWNTQVVSAVSAQLPQDEFTVNPLTNVALLGDPALAPTGDQSVLFPSDPVGDWCRPPPVLFVNSSPLASTAFWIPFEIALAAAVVLWMSRGARMPRL
jgi:hypothetical protein